MLIICPFCVYSLCVSASASQRARSGRRIDNAQEVSTKSNHAREYTDKFYIYTLSQPLFIPHALFIVLDLCIWLCGLP